MKKSGNVIQGTFNRIAARYDLMNDVMTLGRHRVWCREVARRASLEPRGRLLDLATGTGKIAVCARRLYPLAEIVGADFSEEMLSTAASKHRVERIRWVVADANRLPFQDGEFDAITQGYLLRNVEDLRGVLDEQFRVIKPGGRLVVLETCPPQGALAPLIRLCMRLVIPFMGQLIAGDRDSYEYLEDSTLKFIGPQQLSQVVRAAGFSGVSFRHRFFGTNVILWATKP